MIRLIYLIPGLLILFGVLIAWDNWRFYGAALPADGEVLSVRYVYDSRKDTTGRTVEDGDHYPTVRYRDAEGAWWQAETTEPVLGKPPEIGETVAILYHPDNRGWVQVRIDPLRLWLVPLALIGLGLAGVAGTRLVLARIAAADRARGA